LHPSAINMCLDLRKKRDIACPAVPHETRPTIFNAEYSFGPPHINLDQGMCHRLVVGLGLLWAADSMGKAPPLAMQGCGAWGETAPYGNFFWIENHISNPFTFKWVEGRAEGGVASRPNGQLPCDICMLNYGYWLLLP